MTSGFMCFIPLVYNADNNDLNIQSIGGIDILKTIIVSRLLLDNISHIKAYWVMMGIKMAQVCLNFGADDLDGTIVEEKIGRDAGTDSATGITELALQNIIENAGNRPVLRDTFYNNLA